MQLWFLLFLEMAGCEDRQETWATYDGAAAIYENITDSNIVVFIEYA